MRKKTEVEAEMSKLSRHQQSILSAMAAIRCCSAPAKRNDIGHILSMGRSGIQLRTMLALQAAGLVKPESELVIELVKSRVCRCGCDRWLLTPQGMKQSGAVQVRWTPAAHERARRAVVTELRGGW